MNLRPEGLQAKAETTKSARALRRSCEAELRKKVQASRWHGLLHASTVLRCATLLVPQACGFRLGWMAGIIEKSKSKGRAEQKGASVDAVITAQVLQRCSV